MDKINTTLSVAQLAAMKGCSRQTIYNNRDRFDWEGSRIIYNQKAKSFRSKMQHVPKMYKNDYCGIKHNSEMCWYDTDCGENIGELFMTYTHRYCPFCGKGRRYLDNNESNDSC